MTADRIVLRDFRNIESADISLAPGVNVFLGNNAQGKTNLLESLYLFAAGRSHRTSHERDMVRFGQPYFELSLETSAVDVTRIGRSRAGYVQSAVGTNDSGRAEYTQSAAGTNDGGRAEYTRSAAGTNDGGRAEYTQSAADANDSGRAEYTQSAAGTNDSAQTEFPRSDLPIRRRELGFKVFAEGTRKRECKKNGVVVPLTELIGAFRAVLFCPEHLSIVKSGPAERRSFLDIALCQLKPVYLKSLSRHNRILKQRNALLKQLADGNGDSELLEVASDQLAREAAYIFVARRNYIRALDIEMKRFFLDLCEVTGESEQPSLVYHSSLGDDCELDESGAYKCYLERLSANTAREEAAGATLYGSHKDDIIIRLDGRDARLYASQGQQRSLALSMKLGEGQISRSETGDEPVYLFDDVLSELDPRRQLFLLSKLRSQVIMTACTPPSAEAKINANIINVFQGKTF